MAATVASLPLERHRLVEDLRSSGYLHDERVAQALEAVPREAFLDPAMASEAYEDHPLPIGKAQTMSAPHMVAMMCDALHLRPGMRVLEVGAGSGYHAAVVARLIAPGPLLTIEFDPDLAQRARAALERAGVHNVTVREGDGARGAPDRAPFDRIYLACTARAFPPPLLKQLAEGGWILGPIGPLADARLVRRRHTATSWEDEDLGACTFVPLRGGYAWPGPETTQE